MWVENNLRTSQIQESNQVRNFNMKTDLAVAVSRVTVHQSESESTLSDCLDLPFPLNDNS